MSSEGFSTPPVCEYCELHEGNPLCDVCQELVKQEVQVLRRKYDSDAGSFKDYIQEHRIYYTEWAVALAEAEAKAD